MVLSSTFVFPAKHKKGIYKPSEYSIYLKYHFDIEKRNPTMFLVPSLYTIAKGDRHYFGEIYGTLHNDTLGRSHISNQLRISTIDSNSKTMPVMFDYINPKLYHKTIFADNILSPFHHNNRKLYKFRHGITINNEYTMYIRPRTGNVQLVWGSAQINATTGKVISCRLNGEYDMLKYEVTCEMDTTNNSPKHCYAKSKFSFLGNKISTRFEAHYGVPTKELPEGKTKEEQMSHLRSDSLTAEEQNLYDMEAKENSGNTNDTTITNKSKSMHKKLWDIVDDYLIGSIRTQNRNGEIRLSPIIDPTQLSYSNSKGLSYKIKISAKYNFDADHSLALTPKIGYYFKLNRMFVQIPLRWQIHQRHNQWIQMRYEAGNRISNSSILDAIKEEQGDKIDFSKMNLEYFYDYTTSLEANTNIGKCLALNIGLVSHKRTAVNKAQMESLGKATKYKSFAPSITLQIDPFHHGPIMTANYERGIKGIFGSNTEYERWEGDISYNKTLNAGRQYNLRIGAGTYTNHSTSYFVDYRHFHDSYLNDSWNDDWTGKFQLLSSQWYNASEYYLKANAAYESPLMLAAWTPFVGKYIETERLYLNLLRIQHTRFYSEIGYGFTTRLVTIGIFAGMLNGGINDFGAKFSLELFRKW